MPFNPADVDFDQLFITLVSRAERETERRRLRALTLDALAGVPVTGGWYWVPLSPTAR